MVRVKICGVTSVEDALAAAEEGAFAVGFNFHPPSPRYIDPEAAGAIAAAMPEAVLRVGVFVDRERRDVERIAKVARLTALQFHGAETPAQCSGWSLPVIKVGRLRSREDVIALLAYPVELLLADAYVGGVPGGTGETFDWRLLEGVDRSRIILAGGLTAENVADAVRTVRPYAVDVASGVERTPGVKDREKVREFIRHAQDA